MPLAAGIVLQDRYQVVRSIKSGGMGAVYEARDRRLGNGPCALKEILEISGPDADYVREKFKAEVEALSSLNHSGIPAVRDFFALGTAHYIVMDLVQGKALDEELAECLRSTGRPRQPEAVAADAIQVLDILTYLHNRNLLHRDVKPGNLIREAASGRVKLVDFGLARNYGGQQVMTMVGSPGYCSREQMAGRAEPRSDLYSVGVTMHQMLTGLAPKILSLEPLRDCMPDFRPDLAAIVEKATRLKPEERYSTAEEMLAALRAWMPRTPAAPEKPTAAMPAEPPPVELPAAVPARLPDPGGATLEAREAPFANGRAAKALTALGLAGLGLAAGLVFGGGGSPSPVAQPSPTPTAATLAVAPPPEPTLSPVKIVQPDYLVTPPRGYHPPSPTSTPRPQPIATHPPHLQPRLDSGPDYPTAPPEPPPPPRHGSHHHRPAHGYVSTDGLYTPVVPAGMNPRQDLRPVKLGSATHLALPSHPGYSQTIINDVMILQAANPQRTIQAWAFQVQGNRDEALQEAGRKLGAALSANYLKPGEPHGDGDRVMVVGHAQERSGVACWHVFGKARSCFVAESVALVNGHLTGPQWDQLNGILQGIRVH